VRIRPFLGKLRPKWPMWPDFYNYCVGNKINQRSVAEEKSILFATVGDECYKTEVILQAITNYLAPIVNKRYERAVFNRAKQESCETYNAYFDRLRTLISSCQYGESRDDFLLEKIIYSRRGESMSKTLSDDRDITLERAIDKCRSRELSDIQMQKIRTPPEDDEVKKMKPFTPNKKYDNQDRPRMQYSFQTRNTTTMPRQDPQIECAYCGYNHNRIQRCPAKEEQCRICQKFGHFAKMCRSRRKTVKTMEETEQNELDDEYVLVVLTRPHSHPYIYTNFFEASPYGIRKIKLQY
jgi:hypothetical protein